MDERRKYKRLVIEGKDIYCKVQFTTDFKLLNISLSGASISLYKRLNMGSEYTLHIKSEKETITLKGIVVWERIAKLQKNEKGEMVPLYEVGISFNTVLTEKGTEIIDFIETNFVSKDYKSRLKGIRVEIVGPEKTTITDYHKKYYVTMISEGGMLLQTEQQLKVDNKYKMELIIPDEKETINFIGRVASCLEMSGKDPKRYDTGIEFIEMDRKDKLRLQKFINYLKS